VLSNLQDLRQEVRTLTDELREIKTGENPILQSRLATLREALTALDTNVDRLANARATLIDEAIEHLSRSVADTITNIKACNSRVGEIESNRAALGQYGSGARKPQK
jgi:DNA repair exonuclease SbcCD ATPase subunit